MRFTARKSFIDGVMGDSDENSDFDFIVPAFIDIHCHGGGGKYFSENVEVARDAHFKNGTGTQLASLVTQDIDTLISQINSIKNSDIFGIHLEGPYLSQKFCGAHDPKLLRTPEINEIEALLTAGDGKIKMITIAPELPNAIKAIEYLVANKVIVAIGHSDANAEMTKMAIQAGAKVVTHFNNGMAKIPAVDSLSEITLNSDLYLELILDGVHLSKDLAVEIMNAAPDRIVAITDAMSAAGSHDGDYKIGNLEVTVKDRIARLKNSDALAGSTLTMLDVFLNLIEWTDFEKAVQFTSLNAAKLLSINPFDSYIGIKNGIVTFI